MKILKSFCERFATQIKPELLNSVNDFITWKIGLVPDLDWIDLKVILDLRSRNSNFTCNETKTGSCIRWSREVDNRHD